MTEKSRARPAHFLLDNSFRRNPKVDELAGRGMHGWQAIVLYLDGLAYATHHLTDGFIPARWPRSNGYSKTSVGLLLEVGLWWEARDLGLDGGAPCDDQLLVGYLINDYDAYQVSRATWTETGRKRREASAKAHAARWGGRNGQGR